jgi:hypothetical protein
MPVTSEVAIPTLQTENNRDFRDSAVSLSGLTVGSSLKYRTEGTNSCGTPYLFYRLGVCLQHLINMDEVVGINEELSPPLKKNDDNR